MNGDNPFFSVIVPTYNREALIKATLNSVLAQSFIDFEIIVVDDGGKDNTEYVVKELKNPALRYFKKENSERGAARNFGIDQARGYYITFLDSDDILYPFHLQEAYAFLTGHQLPQCYAQAYEIKEAHSG